MGKAIDKPDAEVTFCCCRLLESAGSTEGEGEREAASDKGRRV